MITFTLIYITIYIIYFSNFFFFTTELTLKSEIKRVLSSIEIYSIGWIVDDGRFSLLEVVLVH